MATDTSLRKAARAILGLPVEDKFRAIQGALIVEALKMADGNKSRAAELLGENRRTLQRQLQNPRQMGDGFKSSRPATRTQARGQARRRAGRAQSRRAQSA